MLLKVTYQIPEREYDEQTKIDTESDLGLDDAQWRALTPQEQEEKVMVRVLINELWLGFQEIDPKSR